MMLLLLICALCFAQTPHGSNGAYVYMTLNGQSYEYDTGGPSNLSPRQSQNYNEVDFATPREFVRNALRRMQTEPLPISYNSQRDRIDHASGSHSSGSNFDYSTPQISHSQSTDAAGNVLGKYSYYDAAGYHDMSYKAGDGIGFLVMGGSLAQVTDQKTPDYDNALTTSTGYDDLSKYRV